MPLSYIWSGRRYKITNVKNTDQVLDLSGIDSRSIIGWESRGVDRQKWDLYQDSGGWTLRCVQEGVYVAVEGHQSGSHDHHYPKDGTKVIASQEPYKWRICHESDNKFRVSVPEVRISMPEVRITMPEVKIFAPDARISVPEVRISVSEVKITMPEVRISMSEARKCLDLPTRGRDPLDYCEIWGKSDVESQLWYFDEAVEDRNENHWSRLNALVEI
ncbi:carbohydrate-binding module family 13 protein [Macrolepiota fuliginosa MF-IS2]|uniref:Carbohydrate-binding module family 13 protein n=1 Tax=Macrolepiota fuliginosa MF-IS2 TaxID=1400762 RepID=A0A9P5X6H6_9AGAR|nr:carbohydrate-binding module family 13 protein [Macrolepiota fuliginosa MF-IS2]